MATLILLMCACTQFMLKEKVRIKKKQQENHIRKLSESREPKILNDPKKNNDEEIPIPKPNHKHVAL